MSGDYEDFWSTLPEKALHPVRVPVLEAFRWIGEPLSPIALVDVLDGSLSMWEAARHIHALESLGVLELAPVGTGAGGGISKHGLFDIPYRLRGAASGGRGR